jgi:hypothetical protein
MVRTPHSNPEVQAVLDGFRTVAAVFDRRVKLATLRLQEIQNQTPSPIDRRTPRQ